MYASKNPTLNAVRQTGLSLIELLVAIAVALFMTTAMLFILIGMRSTSVGQAKMSLLQESERQALTLLTESLGQAGYYSSPLTVTAALALPAGPNPLSNDQYVPGQGLYGTDAAGTPGSSDRLVYRFQSNSGDQVANCFGNTNLSGSAQVVNDAWSIESNRLTCTETVGTRSPFASTANYLVNNVTSMSISYGTDTGGNGSVDSYLKASVVQAGALWNKVHTVRITLTFLDPTQNNAVPLPYSVTQVIALPNAH